MVNEGFKIGILCLSSLGGSSKAAIRLANALSYRNHQVHLITLGKPIWRISASVKHWVCSFHSTVNDSLYSDWTMEEKKQFTVLLSHVIVKIGLDIVHYHYAKPFAEITAGLPKFSIPIAPKIIGTFHGTDATCCLSNKIYLRSLKENLKQTDAVNTVSVAMASLLSEVLPEMDEPIIIPNFIPDNWFKSPTNFLEKPLKNEHITILHVSNLRAVKCPEQVIEYFMILKESVDAKLIIAGDGPALHKIKQFAALADIQSDITFLGACQNVKNLYDQATLLLSTSREESFGIAILEAMARGLPVVSSRVGGVSELIEDNFNGVLYECDDIKEAVKKTLNLIENPSLYKKISRSSMIRAKKYSESKIIRMYENDYQRILLSK